jgi:N-sulfoglucosamine sulfohydrolase
MSNSVLSALGIAVTLTALAPAAPATPNILWLIAEDMGPEALSLSGSPEARTPNIDRLAHDGVYYVQAHLGMVCSVSRSSFMTGMYATTIGAQNHRTADKRPLPDGVRVLTEWLHDAGYSTANLVTLPPSFGFKGTGKTDWNFIPPAKAFDVANWSDLKTHQPFYAQLNFGETHRDYHAPSRADPAKVVLPPYYPDHPIARADWARYLDSASELDRKIDLVLKQLETDGLADNTVIVFFGDNGASMVRAKQFCYEEGFHVPLIIRWPAKYPAPAGYQAGTSDSRFIEGIDLAPTMLEFAHVAKPPKMQGRVFLGEHTEAAREYSFGFRDRCDETAMRIRSVRDRRYRYIRNFTPEVPFLAANKYKEQQYPVWNLLKELHTAHQLTPAQEFLCQPRMPDEELYDLQADPDEIHNLATSTQPDHRKELEHLRTVLERWIIETDDRGRFPENVPAGGFTKGGRG